ncbi:inositol monophosphatase family protein [Paenibacillus sp. NPDC056579]|uniref:inositol monophosphatase family protein n=1 Tax=unclassified Paenibacillus TaxID=185978 RepID=UPI001EF95857|nr:inositol monophosphatase [Paenibacillus sp. H1-7]ULL17725.1 inositol monophosphatase [Paenibacillus sp. H1-7]
MESTLLLAEEVAVQAAKAAGAVARNLFQQGIAVKEKDESGDLLTEADLLAEQIILHSIRAIFPEHQIRSEESGWSGVEGDWLWLVDPLDGTNNFAIGLPVFGVSITLIYRSEPVLGVIYDTMQDKLYVANRSRGATCNDTLLAIPPKPVPSRLTIGWIQGHKVQHDMRASGLRHHLESSSKRLLRLWAPTMQWAMLAQGQIDGIVLYNSEGDDLYSGVLLVREAGGLVMDFEGRPFEGMNPEPYIVACPPDRKEAMLKLVQEGLAVETPL